MADLLSELRTVSRTGGNTYSSYEVIAMVRQAADEIERLTTALESLTKDPPATFAREPDEDWEVIIKMRAVARARLKGDTRPIEVIGQEARDAWPDHP